MSKTVAQYRVQADRETGEWIGEAEYVADVDLATWHTNQDTDDAHFDTYEYEDQTRAVEVRWIIT